VRIIKKHLVKIAQPEQQDRVARELAFDTAILGHHGSQLHFSGHARKTKRDWAGGRNFSIQIIGMAT
jgi:hypothetical protein